MAILPADKEDQIFQVDNFSGGLNSFSPPNKINNNSLTYSKNAFSVESGSLICRPGIKEVASLDFDNVFPDYFTSIDEILGITVVGEGTTRKIALIFKATDSSAAYQTRASVAFYDGISWEMPTGDNILAMPDTNTIEDRAGYCWLRTGNTAAEQLWVTFPNDNTIPKSSWYSFTLPDQGSAPVGSDIGIDVTDGTISDDPFHGPMDNCRYVINHVDRLWGCGVRGDNREFLFFSSAVSSIPGASGNEKWDQQQNWAAFNTGSGQGIRGISAFTEDTVFVGLESSCWLMSIGTGSSLLDSVITMVSNSIGVGSHKSITNVGEDLLFMDQHGDIRSLTQLIQERSTPISSPSISLSIKNRTDDISQDELFKSVGAYHKNVFWLSIKTNSGWELYTLNTSLRIWSGPHVLKNSSGNTLDVIDIVSTSGAPGITDLNKRSTHLYFATDDGTSTSTRFQIYELDKDATSDNGSTIDLDIQTKAFNFENEIEDKIIDWIEIFYKKQDSASGLVKVEAKSDFCVNWTQVGEFDCTSGTKDIDWVKFSVRHLGRGRFFQFRFTYSDVLTNPELINFSMQVRGFVRKSAG